MEIFKKASKKKLRFNTNRGVLSVEHLWDLPKEEIRELVIKAREAAMQSLLLRGGLAPERLAKRAFEIADAMMRQLNK